MIVPGLGDKKHEILFNFNVNHQIGIHNTFLVTHYTKLDERLPALARVLNEWGKSAGIIDPFNGFINSYAMQLMLIHFLQVGVSPPMLPNLNALRPDLFDGNLDINEIEESYDLDLGIEMIKNDTPIVDLLIGIIRYYGFFGYQREGIFVRLGCIADKPKTQDPFFLEEVYDRFTVIKNLKPDKLKLLKTTFLDAYSLLFERPVLKQLLDNEKAFMAPIDQRGIGKKE